jgi:predicted outer membrane repeat protein
MGGKSMYFIRKLFVSFFNTFLLFFFVFISKIFADPVKVSSFAALNDLLQNSATGTVIQITTPTIVSENKYNSCVGIKTIIGSSKAATTLDGNGKFGIYGTHGSTIHLSSITFYNFFNDAVNPAGIKNGSALFFENLSTVYIDGNVNFISNTVINGGGSFDRTGGDCAGLCLNGATLRASSVTMRFINNVSSNASGAAIYFNNSNLRFFNDDILFQDNQSGDEGAALWAWDNATIEFIDSKVTFIGNKADAASQEARRYGDILGIGGAISLKQTTANIYFQENTQVQFTSNTARNGGAIYGAGTIKFKCASTSFIDNTATSSGGAIFVANENGGKGNLTLDSSNGDIIFTGNRANRDEGGHDIYFGGGTVNIEGNSGRVLINDGIAGTNQGTIKKSGNGLFILGGINRYFDGMFSQNGGTTTVIGCFFSGYSSVSVGLLEISTGADISTGTIALYNGAELLFTNPGDLIFSGIITGTENTFIDKQSTGTLLLQGNNNGFLGFYRQLFGNTKVQGVNGSQAQYFTGYSSIVASNLELSTGAVLSGNSSSVIDLYEGGSLTLTGHGDILIYKGKINGDDGTFINKPNSGTLTLQGDNSKFAGTFWQNSGVTVVEGIGGGVSEFFVGYSSITNGSVLRLERGSKLTNGGRIGVWENSVLELTSDADTTLYENGLEGVGVLVKDSTGELKIVGNNGDFKGTYIQSSGTTVVYSNKNEVRFLECVSSITNSRLVMSTGSLFGGSRLVGGNTDIYLGNGGILEIGRDMDIAGQVRGIGFIINTTELTLSGDNSTFRGLFTQEGGGTNVEGVYFGGISSITNSRLELKDGSDIENSGDIYLNSNGTLNIVSNGLTTFRANHVYGKMEEGAVINKMGPGRIEITGDMGSFGGRFIHSDGVTEVKAEYLGETSISSITGGTISFVDGSKETIRGQLQLWDDGVLRIDKSGDLTIKEGEIIGSGSGIRIEKLGIGTMTITGMSDVFKGEFCGEYIQTNGMTIVPDSNHMFKGTNTIRNSRLQVVMNDASENRIIDYKVNLDTKAVLEHISTVSDDLSTTISNIRFVGADAKVKFSGTSAGTWYVLKEELKNSGGEDNVVEFERCYVDVDSDNYTGATYRFTDTVIDIDFEDGGHIDLSTQPKTREVTFDNLVTSNTYLNTTIVMISSVASGSKLIATNNPLGQVNKIKLGILTVGELIGETGHIETHTVSLLAGNIVFEEDSKTKIATLAYEYEIKVSTIDAHDVIVDAYKVTDGNSLNSMNVKEGERALKFSFDSTTNTYYIEKDLEYMGSGMFYVEGHDEFNGESNILARSSSTGERVSVFKINESVDFQLIRLELKEAKGNRGAGLMITTNSASAICIGVTFASNTATQEGGGAIYVSEGANPHLTKTRFIGNSADANTVNSEMGNGGAINIYKATMTLSGILEVIGNSASGKGGAIFINDGFLNIGVDTISAKIFQGNTANGLSNSIYLEGASEVNFGSIDERGKVSIFDPIESTGEMGKVNVNGFTEIELKTGEEGRTVIPNLNVNDSARFNIIGETEVTINNEMIIRPMAELIIDETAGHGKEIQVGNKFVQEGTLRMNLFRKATLGSTRGIKMYDSAPPTVEQFDTGDSDLINVEGGQIELGGSSKLDLVTNDAFNDLETFKWRVFKLMKYGNDGSYTGNFGTVTLVGEILPKSYIVRYDYLQEYIALLAEGYSKDDPKFVSLGMWNMCFNQTEVAKTLDYFYDEAYGGDPASGGYNGETKILGDKLQDFKDALGDGVEDITLHSIGTGGKNIEGLKKALFDLSGYFISNVIISRAYDEAKRDVYNRIYNYIEHEEPTKGIWGQAKGATIETDKDVESPQTFKVNNTGVLVGFDMMASSSVTTGVYAKQNKNYINQGSDLHKADINSYGLGLYGGIVKEKYDIKGLLSFGSDNYEITRCLRFENMAKAKGEFDGISATLDVETGYRIGVASRSVLGRIKLRPYVGVGLGLIHTNGFTENGADIWNLEVKANNYLRAGVGGGVGFTGEGKKFRWNASCGVECMLSGRNNEITSRIMGGDRLPNGYGNMDFQSRSVTLDMASVRGDIGVGYYIKEGLEAYCSGDLRWSSMVRDLNGIIGVRYSFEKWREKKNIEEVKTDNKKVKQFRINAVLFEFDKADIKPEAEEEIKELAKKIGKTYKFEKIRIEGHTDALGSDEYNRKLSLARAHAVHEVFAKYGIETAKIEKIGHGESRPIDSNETEEGKANNRRVEIFVDLY